MTAKDKWRTEKDLKAQIAQLDGLKSEGKSRILKELRGKPLQERAWFFEDLRRQILPSSLEDVFPLALYWEKAFPFAGFKPVLEPESDKRERYRRYTLAKRFCPQLYVDEKLIAEERKYLLNNLDKEEVLEAIFLFELGHFPTKLNAAKLRLLAPLLRGTSGMPTPKGLNEWEVHPIIRGLLEKEYDNIDRGELKDRIQHYFDAIFPSVPGKSNADAHRRLRTCVMKYRVDFQRDSNIYCIQYFAYWPIQTGYRKILEHIHDYEPVYVYVKKKKEPPGFEEVPLLIVFNADPGPGLKVIKPLRHRKRPGHVIRTYFDWASADLLISHYEFNPMAEYMTKAYGQQYYYEPIRDFDSHHVRKLLEPGNQLRLQVPRKWHAFTRCPKELRDNTSAIPVELHPLKTQDLLHIEWSVRDPFQAPFLYPTVGEKNPMMQLPFSLATLYEKEEYQRWIDYTVQNSQKRGFSEKIAHRSLYQSGLLIELLRELRKEEKRSSELWTNIHSIEKSYGRLTPVKMRHEGVPSLIACDEALGRDPDDARARAYRAFWLSELGKFEEALEEIKRAKDCDDKACLVFLIYGRILERHRSPEEALEQYEHATRLEPDNATAFNEYGASLLKSRRPEEAEAAFQAATEKSSRYASAFANLSQVLNERGFFREA
ncbi:MAG: tetratricopeptide repeat protein, partial [Promethearchaeota archaeon]